MKERLNEKLIYVTNKTNNKGNNLCKSQSI